MPLKNTIYYKSRYYRLEKFKSREIHETAFPEEDKGIMWNYAEDFFLSEYKYKYTAQQFDDSLPYELVFKNGSEILYFTPIFIVCGYLAYLGLREEGVSLGGKIFYYFFLIVNIYLMGIFFKVGFDKRPKLIINDKGIQTIDTPFYSWDEIKNENIYIYYHRNVGPYPQHSYMGVLVYEHPGGRSYFKLLEGAKMNPRLFPTILRTYRKRSAR